MKKEKINETIAKWCGFLLTDSGLLYGDAMVVDDVGRRCSKYPNFTTDLNAWDRWVFPKLFHKDIVLYWYSGTPSVEAIIKPIAEDESIGVGLTACEALAKALLKLIGEK